MKSPSMRMGPLLKIVAFAAIVHIDASSGAGNVHPFRVGIWFKGADSRPGSDLADPCAYGQDAVQAPQLYVPGID